MGLFTRIPKTDAASVAERIARRDVVVIDVRQAGEWRHGHIRGSHHVPLHQLAARIERIPRDRSVVTVCASGHRSAAAARMLVRAGYDVENLAGGIRAWARAGLPLAR
ncbi:MAG TPA: rhodanese-like domain-containing protein [Gaiellaceae bacterium]|nr:rhodanese-like domain-containing protein [Gaiellaceae bacterium]